MSSAQIICIQVVPDFAGVLMMMSPARAENRCQRLLSITARSIPNQSAPRHAQRMPARELLCERGLADPFRRR